MAAEASSAIPVPGNVRSSMKTFVMKLLMIEGLTDVYDLDHSTTPDVVRISNVSNIVDLSKLFVVVLLSRKERKGTKASLKHNRFDKTKAVALSLSKFPNRAKRKIL